MYFFVNVYFSGYLVRFFSLQISQSLERILFYFEQWEYICEQMYDSSCLKLAPIFRLYEKNIIYRIFWKTSFLG